MTNYGTNWNAAAKAGEDAARAGISIDYCPFPASSPWSDAWKNAHRAYTKAAAQ